MRPCCAPGPAHVEANCVDATSVPRLAAVAFLAKSARGVVDGALLEAGDCAALLDDLHVSPALG